MEILSPDIHTDSASSSSSSSMEILIHGDSHTAAVVRSPNLEDLSIDLLDFILKKLTWVVDYINFSTVCRIWRSVALEQKDYRIMNSSFHPLLILPYDNSGNLHRKIYNFGDGRVYTDKITIPTAYRDRQYYCGSMFGWLAFADDDCGITLMSPFTNSPHIRLPPVMQPPLMPHDDDRFIHPECDIYKVFISADPSTHPLDYVVAVIFDGEHYGAFLRSGEASWTGIDKSFIDINDIVLSNGRLLAIDRYKQLIAIDYNSGALETSVAQEEHILTGDIAVMQYLISNDNSEYGDICYMVDMGEGELLHVERNFLRDEDGDLAEILLTVGFKVYRLQNSDWVEIHDIGNRVLFVGINSSICTSSTSSFRGNSIYYTDDLYSRCPFDPHTPDMGVFDMETKIIDNLYALPPDDYPTCFLPGATWILPTL